MSGPTTLLPFQLATMTSTQLAAVSFPARYAGLTNSLNDHQLKQWFAWSETNGLDPWPESSEPTSSSTSASSATRGLMDSSVVTMMHAVRGYFRFAHIDGLIPSGPAVYARMPTVHRDESRTQGLDRLELIRFLQVAQTLSVHHGALAYLLAINALGASEAAAVRIEDYADTLRGHRVLHLVDKGNKPATMPLTVPPAGVPLRDTQILARHADPRTRQHDDRARGNLDRHGVHFLTAYVAGVWAAAAPASTPPMKSVVASSAHPDSSHIRICRSSHGGHRDQSSTGHRGRRRTHVDAPQWRRRIGGNQEGRASLTQSRPPRPCDHVQAMRRTRLTVRPLSSRRSPILFANSTRWGAARWASRCSPESQFS